MRLWIAGIALAVGSLGGLSIARRVNMTQIPATIGFQNGAGGLASCLVSFVELSRGSALSGIGEVAGVFALLVGAVTFSGSMVASGKLAGLMRQAPWRSAATAGFSRRDWRSPWRSASAWWPHPARPGWRSPPERCSRRCCAESCSRSASAARHAGIDLAVERLVGPLGGVLRSRHAEPGPDRLRRDGGRLGADSDPCDVPGDEPHSPRCCSAARTPLPASLGETPVPQPEGADRAAGTGREPRRATRLCGLPN